MLVRSLETRVGQSHGGGKLPSPQRPQLVEADQPGRGRRQGGAAARHRLDVPADRRVVRPSRQPQAAQRAAGLSVEGADQRPAAPAMALDRGAVHGVDRHPGAGAQREQSLRARLSVPVHLRRRRKALGFQGSVHLGRCAGPLAGTRTTQRRDGGVVPGELFEVPGPDVTPKADVAASLEARVWAALAEINDPEMPVTLVVGSPDAGRPRRLASLGAFGLMAYSRVHANVREYDVFARKARVEPLRQVGSVVAPDDDLAMAYARATYDEERWVEMMIVPRDAVIRLWGPGESET